MAGWGKAEQGKAETRSEAITVAAYLPITLANSKKVLINAHTHPRQDLLKRNIARLSRLKRKVARHG